MSKIHPLDQPIIEQIREICGAGYPTLEYLGPEGAATIGRMDWWREDKREAELSEQLQMAIEHGDDDALDTAFKAIGDHNDAIVSATLAIVAKRRDPEELRSLLDAAAKNGSAVYSDSSASEFLRKIADLAIKGLAAE